MGLSFSSKQSINIKYQKTMDLLNQYVLTLIKQGQGYSAKVYKCTQNYQTIGYGHKLLPDQIDVLTQVTLQQAQKMLQKDIKKAKEQIQLWFGQELLKQISEQRHAVLIDMGYNLGSVRWPKLTQSIKQKNFIKASQQIMDSKYAKQVKNRAIRNSMIMKHGKMMNKKQAVAIYNKIDL